MPLVLSSTRRALVNAATPQNIINGFSMSGIWPLNRDAFTKDTFTPMVFEDVDNMFIDNFDEEPINHVIREPKISIDKPVNIDITPHLKIEGSLTHQMIDLQSSSSDISPDHSKPYLKLALQEKKISNIGSGIKEEKSTILCNTPEQLEMRDRTKNNSKRNLDCKNKKSKKPKN